MRCVEFVTHIINVGLSKLLFKKKSKPIVIKDLANKLKRDGPNMNARQVDPKLKTKRVLRIHTTTKLLAFSLVYSGLGYRIVSGLNF